MLQRPARDVRAGCPCDVREGPHPVLSSRQVPTVRVRNPHGLGFEPDPRRISKGNGVRHGSKRTNQPTNPRSLDVHAGTSHVSWLSAMISVPMEMKCKSCSSTPTFCNLCTEADVDLKRLFQTKRNDGLGVVLPRNLPRIAIFQRATTSRKGRATKCTSRLVSLTWCYKSR